MHIRDQRPDDLGELHAVVTDAFADTGRVARLVDELLAGPSRVSLVAEDAGELVGHVQLSVGWIDAPERVVEVLILSPLGVITARQRQGIGGQLVQAALSRADGALVFLEGSPVYYSRHGFERASAFGFAPPSVRIPDPAFQVYRGPSSDPSVTGALVYPDAFWRCDCVGLR